MTLQIPEGALAWKDKPRRIRHPSCRCAGFGGGHRGGWLHCGGLDRKTLRALVKPQAMETRCGCSDAHRQVAGDCAALLIALGTAGMDVTVVVTFMGVAGVGVGLAMRARQYFRGLDDYFKQTM